jgi:hypothetical protein
MEQQYRKHATMLQKRIAALEKEIESLKGKGLMRQALLGFAARRLFKPGDLVKRHIWPKRPPPVVPPGLGRSDPAGDAGMDGVQERFRRSEGR